MKRLPVALAAYNNTLPAYLAQQGNIGISKSRQDTSLSWEVYKMMDNITSDFQCWIEYYMYAKLFDYKLLIGTGVYSSLFLNLELKVEGPL